MTVQPATVVGGSTATGIVTLNQPAVVDTRVDLSAGNGLLAMAVERPSLFFLTGAYVQQCAIVPAGKSSVKFTVYTTAVSSEIRSTVTASLNNSLASSTITVKAPAVGSVELIPKTVHSHGGAILTVTLQSPAPAFGIYVNLSFPSNGSLLDRPPSSVFIPGRGKTGMATLIAGTTPAASTVTIEASLGTTNRSATLIVKP